MANPARSLVIPPGPKTEIRRLCVNSAKGFVWSMNCDSGLDPKNSRIEAINGFGLMSMLILSECCSHIAIRSRIVRSNLLRPILI